MPGTRLTERQQQVLDFIRRYIGEHGFAPSYEEIRQAMGVASLNAVYDMLAALERKGAIERVAGRSRAIVIRSDRDDEPPMRPCETIAIIGSGTAASPMAAFLRPRGLVAVDTEFFQLGGRSCFAAIAPDDTMRDAGIAAGDVLVVEHSERADDGAIVVCFVGDRMIVRRLAIQGDSSAELRASRRTIAPLPYDPATVRIVGIVRGIMRKL